MRVLVVEDHSDLAATIGDYLEARGHTVDFAYDGLAGYQQACRPEHDVIVLDRMLPGMDGVRLCRDLRDVAGVETPVLMLTALDTVSNRVEGLAAGADDYLVKPFAMAELEARLSALHRRAAGTVSRNVLQVDDLVFDARTGGAQRGGQVLALNPSTRKLLEALMRNSHRIVRREELEYLLWGDAVPDGDVLRAHMHALRVAVDRPFGRKLIRTLRGSGYRLAPPDDHSPD